MTLQGPHMSLKIHEFIICTRTSVFYARPTAFLPIRKRAQVYHMQTPAHLRAADNFAVASGKAIWALHMV